MFIVSALYPRAADSRFHADYYTGPHLKLARRLLSPELAVIRVTLGEAGLDGSPSAFHAISEMHFADRTGFDAAMARVGAGLFADAANYTNVEPLLQVSLLVSEGRPSMERI